MSRCSGVLFALVAATQMIMANAGVLPPLPPRVLDGHVHITNFSRFSYSDWANASAGTCPCAAPCACDWNVADWTSASQTLKPTTFVFIEVDADPQMWLDEVTWVQGLADAGQATIGGLISKAPPGFGTLSVSDADIAKQLAALRRLPLARGVRGYFNLTDESQWAAVVNHTVLLGDANLSLDVCLGSLGGSASATTALLRLVRAAPNVTFVLDHLGSPPVLGSPEDRAVWRRTVTALAEHPNVFVKIGGA